MIKDALIIGVVLGLLAGIPAGWYIGVHVDRVEERRQALSLAQRVEIAAYRECDAMFLNGDQPEPVYWAIVGRCNTIAVAARGAIRE